MSSNTHEGWKKNETTKNRGASQAWLTVFIFRSYLLAVDAAQCTGKLEGNRFEPAACTSAPADTDARLGLGRRACSKSTSVKEESCKMLLPRSWIEKCSATSLAAWHYWDGQEWPQGSSARDRDITSGPCMMLLGGPQCLHQQGDLTPAAEQGWTSPQERRNWPIA